MNVLQKKELDRPQERKKNKRHGGRRKKASKVKEKGSHADFTETVVRFGWVDGYRSNWETCIRACAVEGSKNENRRGVLR